jgi:hypothetical protein
MPHSLGLFYSEAAGCDSDPRRRRGFDKIAWSDFGQRLAGANAGRDMESRAQSLSRHQSHVEQRHEIR